MSEQQPDETGESTTTQESQQDTGEPGEVSDDRLPEDLRPTEDNPLARHPDQTGDEDDAIGQDTEGEPQTAPLHEGQADYGSGESDSGGSGGGSGNTGGDGTQDGRVDAEESDGSEELENGGGGAG